MAHNHDDSGHHGHPHDWPKQPLVELEKPFVDGRGVIQPLVEQMMKSAVLISSQKGALRANHYHKTDWHYCYLVEGCIEYFHRPTGSTEEPQRLLVRKGEMVFTLPWSITPCSFPRTRLS